MRPEKAERLKGNMWQCRNILVQAGSVGVFILLDDGDNKRDELGPKIQVLDAGSLLLWRYGSLLGLEKKEKNQQSEKTITAASACRCDRQTGTWR